MEPDNAQNLVLEDNSGSGELVFTNYLIIRHLCLFAEKSIPLRQINHCCNDAVLMHFEHYSLRPLVKLKSETDVGVFQDFRGRLIPTLPTFPSFHFKIYYCQAENFDFDPLVPRITAFTLGRFFETQNEYIGGLSLVVTGWNRAQQVTLPKMDHLKVLQIYSKLERRISPIAPLVPDQFPALKMLILKGRDVVKLLLSGTVIPSLTSLILDLEKHSAGNRFPEDFSSTDTIHHIFPNLKSLELHNNTFLNFRRCNHVLRCLTKLERLVLRTKKSTLYRRRNNFAATFGGGPIPITNKIKLAHMCEDQVPGTPTVPQRNGFYATPSLANLKHLKELEITVCHVGHLRVILYLSRPGLLPQLSKLTVSFTPSDPIQGRFKDDYLKILRRYHHLVIFEEYQRLERYSRQVYE